MLLMESAAAIGTGVAVALFAIYYVLRSRKLRRGPKVGHTFHCSQCHQSYPAYNNNLQPLSHVEKGLSVQANPALLGQDLRSIHCPHCHSVQIFSIRKGQPYLAGADLFTPHNTRGDHCVECTRTVKPAPWPQGVYDRNFDEVGLIEDLIGVRSHKCNSLVWFGSAKSVTRKRGDDGGYQCPRCGAKAVDRFYHGPETSKTAKAS